MSRHDCPEKKIRVYKHQKSVDKRHSLNVGVDVVAETSPMAAASPDCIHTAIQYSDDGGRLSTQMLLSSHERTVEPEI